ncbi:MAG: response regulator transcription factor [Nostoc sp. NMS1]|uniref:response regulator transcription factor n=1 Tax=unclassified Nostoc TaxID=2593658 RepID=UPI0025F38301|nr:MULTISPECIES: response regulator transcription factor [unclassified Nostoc]MBN3905504.1 response regulator transcription factor [Nostoc sp. NMS1]MBN3994079.1 response regulator transcription factor [Nostoc sp. NMS2]
MIQVMVVATSPVVRAGLSAVVTTNPRLTVVGSASDLDVLTREVGQLQPDVVLVDLSGNLQQSVWEKLLVIQEDQYPLAMIVIVEDLDSIDLETALRSGIRGILPSTSTESEIVAAVEAIASGLLVLHPNAVELLSIREKVVTNPVKSLTPREIEVLVMLGSGLGNKAIAKRLHISEHTVKFHLSSIFQKLSVSSRTEAVALGIRLGLIML